MDCNYSVHWTSIAERSFEQELEFILLKWSSAEVLAFIEITESFLPLLSTNPFLGKYIADKDIYAFVLSTQTTVFYRIVTGELRVDLLLFFNNRQDPARFSYLI